MKHEIQVFEDSDVEALNPSFNEGKAEKPYQPENGVLAQAAKNLEAAQIAASAIQREKDEAALARARAEIALDDELAPQFTGQRLFDEAAQKRAVDGAATEAARREFALDDELAPQFTAKKPHSQPSAKYNSGNVRNVVVPNHTPGDNRAQVYE